MKIQYTSKGATLSPDGVYRYRLTREWDSYASAHWPRPLLWIMLNPSTADASEDDNTIRRCAEFTKSWGYTGLMVGNLYAYRATDPAELKSVLNPVGPENLKHIYAMTKACCEVVLGWGGHKTPSQHIRAVFDAVRAGGHYPQCLGVTLLGAPKHPLYLPKDTKLQPWQFTELSPRLRA